MKESTKEWLGIQPADFAIYAAFLMLIPIYYSSSLILDCLFTFIGGAACVISCWLGMTPNLELGKGANFLRFLAYPLCAAAFIYVIYLNFTQWG